MIVKVVAGVLLLGMALALIRAVRGPSVFERILAAEPRSSGDKSSLVDFLLEYLESSVERTETTDRVRSLIARFVSDTQSAG